ncbi:hypothetical protein ACH5RR_009702 [Cinchona calisaya]|uniref:CN hydrolase domain-containing protein n=1 Tax=Cinchona calisaya TaxID=153742 RepID=A0ABD3AHS1_9GENT
MEEGKRMVTVSALQFSCTDDISTNLATAETLVGAAHQKGANIILIQKKLMSHFVSCGHSLCNILCMVFVFLRMQKLAKELGVVIPVSFFEEANNARYNSVAVIDADGTDPGLYRKSHIPDEGLDSRDHRRRVMQGHAGANVVPLIVSNRIGKEIIQTEHGKSEITFYGNSFIAGPTGEIILIADDKEETVLVAQFDLDQIKSKRVFRDRRPDLYKVLLTLDGSKPTL